MLILKTLLLSLLSFSALAKDVVNTTYLGNLAVEGYDVVSYFEENQAVKGSKELTFKYKGANWRFSKTENLEKFKSNPEKYEPQYGGYCAYAMAKGSKAGIDPKAFKIVDGKLFLNYDSSIQAKWEAGMTDFIVSADKKWNQLIKK